MVFVGGPRQVGKTTVALSLLGSAADESSPAYLNWDYPLDREAILSARLPARQRLVIFDEIHKYAGWRGLIKGLYDKNRSSISFLVTGSARLDLLLAHLPACVGSPLSVNHLRKLLQASHESVERWIAAFERLYLCYRLAPFGSAPIRAVRKERKLYFWDWSRVDEPGARFENMVAGHLLKYCHMVEDMEGHAMELRFLRDTDGREIDFVVLRDGRPEFAVEGKSGERRASPACRYMRERSSIPRWYQVHLGTADFGDENSATRVLPFPTFCRELSLP